MSWLRNTSFNLGRLSRTLEPKPGEYEPHAAYQSFCRHWQQVYQVIVNSEPQKQSLHDDVLAVVNHLEQLASLLSFEARARELNSANLQSSNPAACLEHLLSENLLDKLYEWAICTGRYENAVRLEQLKIYSLLVHHYSAQVLAAEPFLRPLLKLLSGFSNDLTPPDVENQLITLLNQLCVVLMQNIKFVDLFFLTNHQQNETHSEFIIVRLLMCCAHREGGSGAAARDALLLCANMSARQEQLARYMTEGNICPLLATGLSGLYSLLPRTLSERVPRLSPDDINRIHKLPLFVDSLEFCNAVAQVAHPSIKRQLLDFLHQGFLVPVMGPALLQSGAPEQIAALAYLELSLRCVSEGGLLKTILKFLTQYEYDGVKIMDVLLRRLDGDGQLSLVTLSLMETLIDLNCEDVMIELIFKYLLNRNQPQTATSNENQVGFAGNQNVNGFIPNPNLYKDAAAVFLSFSPDCCSRPLSETKVWAENLSINGKRVVDWSKNVSSNKLTNGEQDQIAMSDLVQEVNVNYGNPNETLIGNYHSYLCDARFEIACKSLACSKWNTLYQQKHCEKETDIVQSQTKELDSILSVATSGYETIKNETQNSDSSGKEQDSLTSLDIHFENRTNEIQNGDGNALQIENNQNSESSEKIFEKTPQNCDFNTKETQNSDSSGKEQDSLSSFGESSGYDSFRYHVEEIADDFAEESFWKHTIVKDVPSGVFFTIASNKKVSAEHIIGPLLSSLLKKTSMLLELDLEYAMKVSGVVSKLAAFPIPSLSSFLLCGRPVHPNMASMIRIFYRLKQEVDELTSSMDEDMLNLRVDEARIFLIRRELTRANWRRHAQDDDSQSACIDAVTQNPIQNEEVVFRRNESKRRSISSSFTSMFSRRLSSGSSPVQQTNTNQTNSTQKYNFTQEQYWNQSVAHRTILNAVIFDEWLKELSALSSEQALRACSENEDDLYLKSLCL